MTESEQGPAFATADLGERGTAVVGNTYGGAVVLKAHGGKWTPTLKMWLFAAADDAKAAAAELDRLVKMAAARHATPAA